jgi:polysaccharide export outer membrane protein
MRNFWKKWWSILPVLAVLLTMNSCGVLNQNIMLRTPKEYQFDALPADSALAKEYKLSPNDVIELRLFANDGFKMIDIISSGGSNNTGTNLMLRNGLEYTLDQAGICKLPIVGNVLLSGMTLREAEKHLEDRYSEFYVKPFVILQVINRRVIVFPGEAGTARVINLVNNNTTVIEALALAGGISANGKAQNIKLIRQTNDPNKPYIYKLDLSKIDGIKQGNMVVQTNDIIYVEPRKRYASQTLREVTPVLSLLTSMITFYFLVQRF